MNMDVEFAMTTASPPYGHGLDDFLDGLARVSWMRVGTRSPEMFRFSPGPLASQGTPANSLLLLVSGRAQFSTAPPTATRWCHVAARGEVIGGAALQSRPYNYIVSTETVKNSILVWDSRQSARWPYAIRDCWITHWTWRPSTSRSMLHAVWHSLVTQRHNSRHPGQPGSGHSPRGPPKGVELDVTE